MRRRLGALVTCCVVVGACTPTPTPPPGTTTTTTSPPSTVAAALTRYPYLTDAVGLSMTVNWATDRSGSNGSVRWGAVSGSTCTPTNVVNGTRRSITVGALLEYQWTATLALPAAGSYCYRPYFDAVDLLKSDASPRFTTQVQKTSTETFSFAVFGDWGMLDPTGGLTDQANVIQRIAASGPRFVITTGDNAYPNGSEANYGDLKQVGPETSEVFGPTGWPVAGRSIPVFPTIGNHGMALEPVNPHFVVWPQPNAVFLSGGRYDSETYCCLNGTTSTEAPSAWYAFNAGNSRFYVLEAAWSDTNNGTADEYKNDYDYHWTPTSAEYLWLKNDLEQHASSLKFAFFHFPIASDNVFEGTDPYLSGAASLEGLLSSKGVKIAFTGHTHLYERNNASGAGGLVNYVTGGGGADQATVGPCSSFDAYGIGWSPAANAGSKCGAAPMPTSSAQVFHFLKVTVAGNTVTVTPTDSLGHTFDVKTYNF